MRRTNRRLLFATCALLIACSGDSVTPGGSTPDAPPSPPAPPELLTAHGAHVLNVRESLRRRETHYAQSLSQLERSADRALEMEPVSVMDKDVVPPSGDKHDYMSQAPYYWPNPSTPDGLPYVRRDGERNPEIERITDRENLERLSRAVFTLGLAYYLTGREEYATAAARLVEVWFLDDATRMNPHLDYAQRIPGITEGRSAGIIETRFVPPIIDGVLLLHGSPAWTATDDAGFKAWMRSYLQWLRTSEKGRAIAHRGNNLETWYRVQVAALGLYTGDTEAARTAISDGKLGIGGQFDVDGRQPRELERTRAWEYSIFNLTAYIHLAALGERVGEDVWNYRTDDRRSLRAGVDYLVPFATGEEEFPYTQITEFQPSDLHPVLRWAALGWGEPGYREIAQQIGGSTPLLNLTLP